MIDPIGAAIKIAGSGLKSNPPDCGLSRKIWRTLNPRGRRLAPIFTRAKP
jgi:hypothetical protein